MSRVFFNRALCVPLVPPPGSSHGQVSDENPSLCLRAQQHGEKEDSKANHRGDEDGTRQGYLMGGRVQKQ